MGVGPKLAHHLRCLSEKDALRLWEAESWHVGERRCRDPDTQSWRVVRVTKLVVLVIVKQGAKGRRPYDKI